MPRLLTPLLLLVLFGCRRPAPDGPVPQWSLVEDFRIGGADTGAASLTAVLALSFDRDGAIWMLDRDVPELRIFDGTGRFVRTIGRRGEGPGEIAATHGFAIASNGIVWVPDYRLHRYNAFDTAGRFLASHPDLISSWGYMWDGGVDGEGRLFDNILVRRDTTSTPMWRRFRDTSLAVADTLPYPNCGSSTRRFYTLKAKNGMTMMMVPFSPIQVGAVSPEGVLWCSSGEDHTALAIRLDGGDTLARITYLRDRLPVPRAARDSQVARITKQAQEMGADLPDFGLIPEFQPAIIALKLDDAGRVWLRVPDTTGTRFDLFDRTGRRLAEVTFAEDINRWAPIAFRGDTLVAVVLDADEVPTVRRLHLVREGPSR